MADLAITHTIAFYSRNKDLPIYRIPSVFETIEYARLRLFGHDYYASLPNHTYYPVAGRLSAIGVMRERKTGIYVDKKPSGHEKIDELNREFKGLVAFTLIRYFKTNQGDVCIYRWDYKG